MKKQVLTVVASAMICLFAFVFVGCGSAQDGTASSASAEASNAATSAAASSASASAAETSAVEASAGSEVITETTEDGLTLSNDSSGFVLLSEAVPDAILEIRYYSTYNFVGERIDGYEEPLASSPKKQQPRLKK